MTIIRPDPPLLRALLDYLPEPGELWWLRRPDSMFKAPRYALWWNGRYAGQRAFTAATDKDGHRRGAINGRRFMATPVIWAWMTGAWPEPGMEIDHINGDPSDDRWANLRLVSHSQQMWNTVSRTRRRVNHPLLPRGVYPRKGGTYQAAIQVNGIQLHLGTFSTPEEAHAAYCRAAEAYHGEFAFHRSRRQP